MLLFVFLGFSSVASLKSKCTIGSCGFIAHVCSWLFGFRCMSISSLFYYYPQSISMSFVIYSYKWLSLCVYGKNLQSDYLAYHQMILLKDFLICFFQMLTSIKCNVRFAFAGLWQWTKFICVESSCFRTNYKDQYSYDLPRCSIWWQSCKIIFLLVWILFLNFSVMNRTD